MARGKVVEQHKKVTIDLTDVTVEFEGHWARADVDKAYRLALKRLGAYYVQMRAKDRAERLAAVEEEALKEETPSDEGANDDLKENTDGSE